VYHFLLCLYYSMTSCCVSVFVSFSIVFDICALYTLDFFFVLSVLCYCMFSLCIFYFFFLYLFLSLYFIIVFRNSPLFFLFCFLCYIALCFLYLFIYIIFLLLFFLFYMFFIYSLYSILLYFLISVSFDYHTGICFEKVLKVCPIVGIYIYICFILFSDLFYYSIYICIFMFLFISLTRNDYWKSRSHGFRRKANRINSSWECGTQGPESCGSTPMDAVRGNKRIENANSPQCARLSRSLADLDLRRGIERFRAPSARRARRGSDR